MAAEAENAAGAVLRFWFEETAPEQHFKADPGFDALCAARFAAVHALVLNTSAEAWRSSLNAILAAVILLDQMSRNIYRGMPAAFAADPLARRLTAAAIAAGWDIEMTRAERHFLYLPFMHSENPADQVRSIELFERLGDEEALRYARAHAEAIARFGRFPSRNAVLGRTSSPAELAYLAQKPMF